VRRERAAQLLARRAGVERGLADVLIVSGTRTGSPASADDVQRVRAAAPTLIGSGLTPDNVLDLLPRADGAIVGTYFHVDGIIANPVDPGRVDRFMSVVRGLRQA
jgi:predicted TIM-barrel enzyme